MIYLQLLCLIVIANGFPIVGCVLLKDRVAYPLDLGTKFIDGRAVLGSSKTFRGIIFSILATGLCAPILGLSVKSGVMISLLAMAGDCLSSFVKRRMGKEPESQALGLDQIPESLFPLLGMKEEFNLAILEILVTVITFIFLELLISRYLFKIRIRKHPY